jgi:hypothetical protein
VGVSQSVGSNHFLCRGSGWLCDKNGKGKRKSDQIELIIGDGLRKEGNKKFIIEDSRLKRGKR